MSLPQPEPPPIDETTTIESTYDARREIRRLQQQLDKVMQQNEVLQAHKAGLEATLNKVTASKSWRITAPLRMLMSFLKLFSFTFHLRNHKLSIKAGNNVEVLDSEIKIIGSTPYILLNSDKGPIRVGWSLLNVELDCEQDYMFFTMYYDLGGGFIPERFLTFSLEKGANKQLIFLPGSTKALRLDPFSTSSNFSLEKMRLKELGSLQMGIHLLKTYFKWAINDWPVFKERIRELSEVWVIGGLSALKNKFLGDPFTKSYQDWISKYDRLSNNDREQIRRHISKFDNRPLISVVMPTYNTPEKWLRKAIESVRNQLYPNWELCIADDASQDSQVKQVLKEFANKDKRIKIVYHEINAHIGETTNTALELASGDYVAFLDHDDELTEHALYLVVNEINNYPQAQMIYSDEDKLNQYGLRFNPYFKSDWNPDLLLSQNYICHLSVYKRELLQKLGGLRKGFDGAQDWDLALRASEILRGEQIRHIPRILYHWRVIESSTAHSVDSKPYVLEAQAKTVREHLRRKGTKDAKVEIQEDIYHLRVTFPLPSVKPLVSLIIPTRDKVALLRKCVSSILERTDYNPYEIIIVDNSSHEKETFDYFETLAKYPNVRIIKDERPFNFSRLNNYAAQFAKGDILGFLNNDLEVIAPEWLSEMVTHALRSEVGIVGAKLLYPNGALQHAGIILGIGGIAGHNHKGRSRFDTGYFNRAALTQNFSAVTGACMIMRSELFKQLRGFDENNFAVAFNDVDICLRAGKEGYLVVFTPYAELYHHESASRGYENTPEKVKRFEVEVENMKKRWGASLLKDPYYNPNLSIFSEDFALSFPPRLSKPWKMQ